MEYDSRLHAVTKALKDVEPPGDFFVCGMRAVFPQPGLLVDGIGDIATPMADTIAQALIAKCHLAPYGHGEKTLVDTQVRNTWELSAGQFTLSNPAWHTFVKNDMLPSIRVPLGIDANVQVEAKLYKMLLYEVGGKFEKHQDSEKEDGMFGTLVVVLPGRFEGGELIVYDPSMAQATTRKKHHVWDPADKGPFALKFAAFYGDCPHEVKPVTTGYRLCLTYNLVAVSNSSVPRFVNDHPRYAALKHALCEFFCDQRASQHKRQRLTSEGTAVEATGFDLTDPATHRDCKLVYVLDHKYTKVGVSFQTLKNKDALVAASLAAFCQESRGALELFLCDIKYEFCYRGPEGKHYDSSNEKDHEVSRKLILEAPWVQPMWQETAEQESGVDVSSPGNSYDRSVVGDLQSEVAPAGLFSDQDLEFDDHEEELFTGNEGSQLDKWYTTAALLVVPIAVRARFQFAAERGPVFGESWLELVESNPPLAIAVAVAVGDAPQKWSLTENSHADKMLDALAKLTSLDAIRGVILSFETLDFQPRLGKMVLPFGCDAVVAMVKTIDATWSKRPLDATAVMGNRIHLVTSLLDGVQDAATIAAVLNAVKIKPTAAPRGVTKVAEYARVYARVLALASTVSVDQVKPLLRTSDIHCLIDVVVGAVLQLDTTSSANIRAVVRHTLEQLNAKMPAIRKLSYPTTNWSCPQYPHCECKRLKAFLESANDTATFPAAMLESHLNDCLAKRGLTALLAVEPSADDAGSMVVTKTYDELYRTARHRVEMLGRML